MVTYPRDWRIVPVEQVADIGTGCRDTQDNNPHGKFPFFVRSSVVERIGVADYDCEAVLTAGDGVGTGKVFHYVKGQFAAHQRVYVMNNFREVSGKYFYYYFSRTFINEVEKYTAKSSVDSVRKAMIARMEIPVPSINEQNAIVNSIELFDTHIANLSELIEKKKAIRDGALEDLISGRTRLDDFTGDWKETRLLDCVTLVQGLTYTPENVVPHGVIVLRSSNIKDGNLSLDDNVYVNCRISEEQFIQEGDVLICVRNGSSALIGKSCVLPRMDNASFGAFMSILRGDTTGYISKAFRSESIQEQVRGRSSATINQITKKDFKSITLRMPDKAEQKSIADVLTAMDDEIKSLTDERDKIIQIREGAMDDLLTGRVRLAVE